MDKRVHGIVAPAANALRLRHVDALRAIAALLVVWLHVTQNYVQLDPGNRFGGRYLFSIAQDFDFGRIGVVLFFLVSGYVIPFSIPRGRDAAIGQFLIKRFFRIYPAYWLSVPLGAWAVYWMWGRPFGVRDFVVNLTLMQDMFGIQPAQGVYWTLLVELGFYLLCVLLYLANSLYDPIRIGVLASILALTHSAAALVIWLGLPLIGQPLAFWCLHLSLMLCGTLYRHCTLAPLRAGAMSRAILFGLLLYYLVVFPAGAVWARGLLHNYVVSVALGLLLFVVGISVLRIQTRLTDRLGAISYSIYLFHLVVYYPIFWWLSRQPVDSVWREQRLGVYLIANAALTIALAWVIHRLVEQPGIRFGHRCAQRWARARSRPKAPSLAVAASRIGDRGVATPPA